MPNAKLLTVGAGVASKRCENQRVDGDGATNALEYVQIGTTGGDTPVCLTDLWITAAPVAGTGAGAPNGVVKDTKVVIIEEEDGGTWNPSSPTRSHTFFASSLSGLQNGPGLQATGLNLLFDRAIRVYLQIDATYDATNTLAVTFAWLDWGQAVAKSS